MTALSEEEIQVQLFKSQWIGTKEFIPVCYIQSVEEPEFGCEGRPENQPIYATLTVYCKETKQYWKITESELYRTGFDDNMWIGYFTENNQKIHFVSVRENNKLYHVVEKGDWIAYYKEIVRV